MSAFLLEVRGVSKTFPGVKALSDVSLSVARGEIVALVGQNGSGKSTLVKVLAGVYPPDAGSEITLGSGRDGSAAALHFIHQDLGLVGSLSTIENLDLGRELGRRALLPSPVRAQRRRAEELIRDFGADFDVRVPVQALTAAERTIVGIARALDGWTHPNNVLVLDEPTASLHRDEVGKLFLAVRRVAERGAGVIFISHRLDEVLELADRVVALRDGGIIADVPRGGFDHDDLVRMIAGDLANTAAVSRSRVCDGGSTMSVRGLAGPTIAPLDFDVQAGEILGISGGLGSGREYIAPILFGAAPGTVSELIVDGCAVPHGDPRRAIGAGLAYVPADRHRDGGLMKWSARENITLPRLRPLRRAWGRLDRRRECREVDGWMQRVGVRPAEPDRRLELFSGGNQQKVVLAKWLRNQPKILLLSDPTQGVDVGAKTAIYQLILAAAAGGAAVLVCSSDEKELVTICDRILVLRDGVLVAQLDGPQLSEAALVRAALGGDAQAEDSGVNLEEFLRHG